MHRSSPDIHPFHARHELCRPGPSGPSRALGVPRDEVTLLVRHGLSAPDLARSSIGTRGDRRKPFRLRDWLLVQPGWFSLVPHLNSAARPVHFSSQCRASASAEDRREIRRRSHGCQPWILQGEVLAPPARSLGPLAGARDPLGGGAGATVGRRLEAKKEIPRRVDGGLADRGCPGYEPF